MRPSDSSSRACPMRPSGGSGGRPSAIRACLEPCVAFEPVKPAARAVATLATPLMTSPTCSSFASWAFSAASASRSAASCCSIRSCSALTALPSSARHEGHFMFSSASTYDPQYSQTTFMLIPYRRVPDQAAFRNACPHCTQFPEARLNRFGQITDSLSYGTSWRLA